MKNNLRGKIVLKILIGIVLVLTFILGINEIWMGLFATSLLNLFQPFIALRLFYIILGISAIIVSVILAIKTFRK
jgi:uncharacterized membrane protein YuzA (DUF378 family)